jgi:predicted dehydrogenase
MLNIALYGTNGHQLPLTLPTAVRARVVAVEGALPERMTDGTHVYGHLEDVLADATVDLVSICGPVRRDSAGEIIACLRAGKHVLAEKPAAFTYDELAAILAAEAETGRQFREMNDSMMEPSVRAIRRLVDAGALGEVVQVSAQKSYPWHDRRPGDLDTDGGLTRWIGIHALRFVIAATGRRIERIMGTTTHVGHPEIAQLAGSYACALEGGPVATITLNYLNPPTFGNWGNEALRVWGTTGMAESIDGFRRQTFYPVAGDPTDLPTDDLSTDYLEHYVNYLLDGTPMPTNREEELAALRAAIAAQEAVTAGVWVDVP